MPTAVTREIARFAATLNWEDIPEPVIHEAKRSLLNYFATAIAGSVEPATEKSITVLLPFSGAPACRIIGRAERADMALASYVNAMSANIFDYDDTHQATVIHPTAPVAPSLFAYAEANPCDGRALLKAFIVGGEIECRVGNAVSPSHYARGWHITSTCGIFGAAVGAGCLMGLSEDQFVSAVSNASAQSAGLVETLGTMSKSISVGNAARNGLLSALLAAETFTGPEEPLSGARGFLRVFSDEPALGCITEGLGQTWEIAKNTYKPYPAGIVLHPVIEACLRLYHERDVRAEDVSEVELVGHPLLQQRTDRPDVTTGRLSQVSAHHAVAIAFRRGKAGLDEFDDAAVAETLRDGIRPKITFVDDTSLPLESVRVTVKRRDGQVDTLEIAAAKGGPTNPMSDKDLEAKLEELAAFRGFDRDIGAIASGIWGLDKAANAADVMALADLPAAS